jgi:hypothetical protein
MRKKSLVVLLLLVVTVIGCALALAGCGGEATTTTTEAATTSSSGPGGAAPVRIVIPLSGAEVVPPVQTAASGIFTLLVEAKPNGTYNISFQLEVTDLTDATAAHIHLGAKGAEGEVVLPLFTGPTKSGTFTGVLAEATVSESEITGPLEGKKFQDLVGLVLAGQTYVNVHTVKYPNGEIRGQIVIPGYGEGTTTSTGNSSTTTSGGTGSSY